MCVACRSYKTCKRHERTLIEPLLVRPTQTTENPPKTTTTTPRRPQLTTLLHPERPPMPIYDSIFCWRVCALIECPTLARKRVNACARVRKHTIAVRVCGTRGDGRMADWFAFSRTRLCCVEIERERGRAGASGLRARKRGPCAKCAVLATSVATNCLHELTPATLRRNRPNRPIPNCVCVCVVFRFVCCAVACSCA